MADTEHALIETLENALERAKPPGAQWAYHPIQSSTADGGAFTTIHVVTTDGRAVDPTFDFAGIARELGPQARPKVEDRKVYGPSQPLPYKVITGAGRPAVRDPVPARHAGRVWLAANRQTWNRGPRMTLQAIRIKHRPQACNTTSIQIFGAGGGIFWTRTFGLGMLRAGERPLDLREVEKANARALIWSVSGHANERFLQPVARRRLRADSSRALFSSARSRFDVG